MVNKKDRKKKLEKIFLLSFAPSTNPSSPINSQQQRNTFLLFLINEYVLHTTKKIEEEEEERLRKHMDVGIDEENPIFLLYHVREKSQMHDISPTSTIGNGKQNPNLRSLCSTTFAARFHLFFASHHETIQIAKFMFKT